MRSNTGISTMLTRPLLLALALAVLVPVPARARIADPVRLRFSAGAPAAVDIGRDQQRARFDRGFRVDGAASVDLAPALSLVLLGSHESQVPASEYVVPYWLQVVGVDRATVTTAQLGLEVRKRIAPSLDAYLGAAGGAGFFGGGHVHLHSVAEGDSTARHVGDSAPAIGGSGGLRVATPLRVTLDLGWQGVTIRSEKGVVTTNAVRLGLVF